MFARVLSLAVLAFAPLAFAAPAPFVKPATPPQANVELRGHLPSAKRGGLVPRVITSEAAYRGLADAWGIKSPPRVNFRTHFIFVHVYSANSAAGCQIVGGDLRAGAVLVDVTADRRARLGIRLKCMEIDLSPRYLIKSFPRSAVKTVNGQPLPRE
jgi:hypothetical protein